MIFALYGQKASTTYSLPQGAKPNEVNGEQHIVHDIFRLQQLLNSLQVSLRLSSSKPDIETSRPLYSWLNEFSKNVEKLADLSEQVFSSISSKNNFDELINQVRKIEMNFSPLMLNEFVGWNRTAGQLSVFTQALQRNRSLIYEVIDEEPPKDSSRCDGIRDLVSLLSNPESLMHMGAFVESVEEKQIAPIVRITDSLVENIYNLLPQQHPLRVKIANERVKTLKERIIFLEQNGAARSAKSIDLCKSRLIAEQEILIKYQQRKSKIIQAKVRQSNVSNESLQAQIKEAVQTAESANSQAAAFSHLPAVISSLTEQLQQTKDNLNNKSESFSRELNKMREEKYKVDKELRIAKSTSKRNFFVGTFLGVIGLFAALRNSKKPIDSQISTGSLNSASLINFFPPKQPENEVNPFDLSAGIPFA